MLERTQVFVDTSYLFACFYNKFEDGARSQLEIDIPEVVSVLGGIISQHLSQPVQRQLWYDGIPDSGPHRYQRALRSCDGVQLRAGQLIEAGNRRTQKAVDTRLVADMVVAALRGQCSDIVLVSGDADMLPGVHEATAAGLRVHLYGFGWQSVSQSLRHACDSTTILDPREDFADCIRLQVLDRLDAGDSTTTEATPTTDTTPAEGVDQEETSSPAETTPATEDVDDAVVAADEGVDPRQVVFSPEDITHDQEPVIPPESTQTTQKTVAEEPADPVPAVEEAVPVAPAEAPVEEPAPVDLTPTPTDEVLHTNTQPIEQPQPETPPTELVDDEHTDPVDTQPAAKPQVSAPQQKKPGSGPKPSAPNPSIMAKKKPLQSRYVAIGNEVWETGEQSTYDIGKMYAMFWYNHEATEEQKDEAHLLSGGPLPPDIDRPLLQFACERLNEYTLDQNQRVDLRDGFHQGIRGVLVTG